MGSGMLGFSQGLQSGMNMGMQFHNMRWQNEERKKMKLKEEETKTALSDFFGSTYGQTMMTGGNLSGNDKTMFMTALQGATAEARGVMGAVHQAWQQGDKETYNRELDKLNILLEFYGGNNRFDVENMEAAFNHLEQTFTHEDSRNAMIAGRNIIRGREQPKDVTGVNVAVSAFGQGSPAAITEANKLLGTDYKAEEVTPEMGKVIYKAATNLNNAAALGKSSFTAVLNQMKLDPQYKEAGVDLGTISYDKWTAPEPPTPSKPADMKEVSDSILRIQNAETPKQAQTLANAYITEHGSLEDLGIEGEDIGPYWGENQKYILQGITRDLSTLVNEKGFVRPDEKTERNLFGVKQTMTNTEWYKVLFNDYMSLWDEMKALGVDMTNFPKMAKLSDIGKIEGYAIKGGIKKGDWRPDGWFVNE